MSSRYLRASGNWDGPVWAATSSGTAGSAATPTSADNVYIAANFTVTLTADASCLYVFHTNGTLNLSSYKLTTAVGLSSTGSTARTMNLNNGHVECTQFEQWILSGTNLTFNASSSLVTLNVPSGFVGGITFGVGSRSMNDVRINLGTGGSSSSDISITGSPTFRSLIIQSKNSAAHTVNLDSSAYIQVQKLIAVGASTSNRLLIQGGNADTAIQFNGRASSYGTNTRVVNVSAFNQSGFTTPKYLGSTSIDDSAYGGWLLQDPPKISTLVDPLTTAPGSNPNWNVATYASATLPSAVTSGVSGGGYDFYPYRRGIVSTNTYDVVDEDIFIEVPAFVFFGSNMYLYVSIGLFNNTGNINTGISNNYRTIGLQFNAAGGTIHSYAQKDGPGAFSTATTMMFTGTYASRVIKLNLSSTDYKLRSQISLDGGLTWGTTYTQSTAFTSDDMAMFKSCRVAISSSSSDSPIAPDVGGVVGSINIVPTPAPTNTGAFLPFFM